MKFALKYWWYVYKNRISNSGNMLVLLCVSSFIIALPDLISRDIFTLPLFLIAFSEIFLFELVVFYGYLAVMAVFDIRGNYKYNRIIDKKGYCMESFDYLQKNFIQGKPVNEVNYIELAEHYCRFGDYDSAIRVMDSIKVPESNIYLRSFYIFLFIKIAVSKNDTVLADNIWNSNQNFINFVTSDKKYEDSINFLYLAMIYADCIAGRYDRAFHTCEGFIRSEHLKKFKNHTEKFIVIKIYLLKKMGREAEINYAIIELNDYAERKWKPLFEVARTEMRINAEKAARGELPL